MSSRNVAIADAIVAILNTNTSPGWTDQEFTAVRQLLPLYEFKDIGDLVVSVTPSQDEVGIFTRTAWKHDIQTDVMIGQRLDPMVDPTIAAKSADADAIIELMEDAVELFRPGMQLGSTGAHVMHCRIQTAFDPDYLKDKRVLLTAFEVYSRAY